MKETPGISNPVSGVKCLDCGRKVPDDLIASRQDFFKDFVWIHKIGKLGWRCVGALCRACDTNRQRAR